MKIKIEDIIFWIAILAAISILIWKLFGSPSDIATLVAIFSLGFISELSLWKHLFAMDKKVSIGFIRMKNDINNIEKSFNYRFDNIEKDFNNRFDNIEKGFNNSLSSMDNKLNDIKSLIKKK